MEKLHSFRPERAAGRPRLAHLNELIAPLLGAAAEAGLAIAPASGRDRAEQDSASLQLFAAAGLPEPNPLVPLVVHGLVDSDSIGKVATVLGRQYPPTHRVLLSSAAGATRAIELGALGSERAEDESPIVVFVPPLVPENALASPFGLRALVHRLRAPGGCPWDREQTPASLVRYVLEEAYEVADAIEHGTPADRREELGDLLLQVYLQAEIAEEGGDFDLTDVIRGLAEKLIRRHPHVFGSAEAADAIEVERNWERLKAAERERPKSPLERIPRSLPGLARAAEVQRQLSKVGFDWPTPDGAWAKLEEELGELRAALGDRAATESELGDLLFMAVKVGRAAGADPEAALRGTIERVISRYEYLQRAAAAGGSAVSDLPIERLLELWEDAKHAQRSGDSGSSTGR